MNKELIRELIDGFYADVRRDPELGPVFEGVIGSEWERHLGRMYEFWNTVALGTKSFRGNVFGKHMVIDAIRPAMFGRWLSLWQLHTTRRLSAEDAQNLQQTAQGVARNLFLGLFGRVPVVTRVRGEDAVDRFETA